MLYTVQSPVWQEHTWTWRQGFYAIKACMRLGNIYWQYFLELIFKYRSCSRLCPASSVSCQDFPVFVHATVASSGWTPSPEPLHCIITCCQHYCPGKQHTRSKCSLPRAWPPPLVLRLIFLMPTSFNSEPRNLQFIVFLFFFLELFASLVCLASFGFTSFWSLFSPQIVPNCRNNQNNCEKLYVKSDPS